MQYSIDVAAFDALNWNCRTDGNYDMFDLYSDPRCLILPYSEAAMANALHLLATAAAAEQIQNTLQTRRTTVVRLFISAANQFPAQ